jgi:hypothetical protein
MHQGDLRPQTTCRGRNVHRNNHVHRVEPADPLMPRAIVMQQHSWQRPAWPLATVHTTPLARDSRSFDYSNTVVQM